MDSGRDLVGTDTDRHRHRHRHMPGRGGTRGTRGRIPAQCPVVLMDSCSRWAVAPPGLAEQRGGHEARGGSSLEWAGENYLWLRVSIGDPWPRASEEKLPRRRAALGACIRNTKPLTCAHLGRRAGNYVYDVARSGTDGAPCLPKMQAAAAQAERQRAARRFFLFGALPGAPSRLGSEPLICAYLAPPRARVVARPLRRGRYPHARQCEVPPSRTVTIAMDEARGQPVRKALSWQYLYTIL